MKIYRSYPEFQLGRADAEQAIAQGVLGYRISGKVDWLSCSAVSELLKERYNIDLAITDTCTNAIEIAARDEGFNERMQEEFLDLYGEDVIDSMFREVERKRKKAR